MKLFATHGGLQLTAKEALETVLGQGGGMVRVAAPYLRPHKLEGLLNHPFRLLVDEKNLVRSNRTDCVRLSNLLYAFPERVRTLANLHAKIALGPRAAMVGSANFTQGGFERNYELGMLIEDSAVLAKLRRWFDGLWGHADALRSKERFLELCSGGAPSDPLERHAWELGSARFVGGYLKELGRMIRRFGLKSDDPRLAMNLPRNIGPDSRSGLLPVSVGRRYVAYATTSYFVDRDAVLVLSLPQDCAYLDSEEVDIGDILFGRQSGERREDVPYYAHIPFFEDDGRLTAEVRKCWYRQIEYELQRAKASPWKRYHQEAFYRAATDPKLRQRLVRSVH